MENKNIDQQLQEALEQNKWLSKAADKAKKKTTPGSIKKNMRQKSVVGAILLLILVLTGTFAWQSYQQRAINPFYDPSGNHGVRFHDRLELEDASLASTDARFGYANMVDPDLTIFAENFGDMDVFVRIQLREFFALDNDDFGFYDEDATPLVQAVRDNPNTWPIFRTSDWNVDVRRYSTPAHEMGLVYEDFQLNLGQGYNEAFYFMPTFNRAVQTATDISPALPLAEAESPFLTPYAAHMSEATGAAVDWFTNVTTDGIPVHTYVANHIRDYITSGIPTGPGVTDPAGNELSAFDRRGLDDGTRDWWGSTDYVESFRLYTYDTGSTVELRLTGQYNSLTGLYDAPFTHYAQPNTNWYVDMTTANTGATLPANFRGVMTIQQWEDMGMPQGNFWIHDSQDEDGWFYWMGFLYQGANPEAGVTSATSLLVESLQLPDLPGEWEYALTMTGEAFTPASLEAMSAYISDAAMQIFNVVLDEEERPLGGNVYVDTTGPTIAVSNVTGTLATTGNVSATSFTAVANSLGSIQGTLPLTVDMDLVNFEPAPGTATTRADFTVTVTTSASGHVVRITENILPAAAIGCYWQGTPSNLWTDSTGTEWCHVAVEGPYSMLISRAAHTYQVPAGAAGNRPHSENEFVRWPEATNAGATPDEGPEIRSIVNNWWESNINVSTRLRGAAIHATLPILRTDPLQSSPSLADVMYDETSVAMPIPNSNNGLPFFLSHADVSMRLTARRGPTVTAGAAEWNADQALRNADTRRWWPLRDAGCQGPGRTSASCGGAKAQDGGEALWAVAFVNRHGQRGGSAGAHSVGNAGNHPGFRPAVWIRR